MKTLICIPTYNERESLPGVVARVRKSAPGVDILIIDDNSPDGTGELADQLSAEDPAIHVMHRAEKAGLGRAYLAGFEWAAEHGYSHVGEFDADGSHRPEQLPDLLKRAAANDNPDLVIGSRWVSGGEVVNWPKHREILSRFGNLYVKLWLNLPARDATAGFRVMRIEALQQLDLDAVEARGYFFQVDMTRAFDQAGMRIVEVPISFVERELGTSKMSSNIIVEAMLRTTKLGLRDRYTQLRGKFRR
ncbi:MAG: polyprenol monophosphomannose synthase [Actinomycetaceae bacterium]|nr:polyprenol monophosphomannose synthase [Actinomycetaceae bacterium]